MAWLDGWSKRIEISINDYAGDIGDSVTWFPVTVFLTGSQAEEVFVELTTDAEYLKVAFTEADGTTKLYGEKEFFGMTYSLGSDILTGGTATASSVSQPAASAVDDNDVTFWQITKDEIPSWWKYDFGEAVTKKVTQLTIKNYGSGYGMNNFTLKGSNDDSDWTNIYTDICTDDDSLQTFQFVNAVSYRYYKIDMPDSQFQDWTAVKEFEMMEMSVEEGREGIFHVSRDGWTINANTSIFLYYDSTHADNGDWIGEIGSETGEKVWNDEYKFVSHQVDNDGGNITDSTHYDNDGTKLGANQPNEVAGKVGQGQDFDGANDAIDLGDKVEWELTRYTVSFCFKPTNAPVGNAKRPIYGLGGDNTFVWDSGEADYRKTWSHQDGASSWPKAQIASVMNTGTWYLVSGKYDGTNISVYLDGELEDTDAANNPLMGAVALSLGSNPFFTDYEMDEVRISSMARSTEWILGTKNTLWDTLFTYGSEESIEVEVNAIFFGMNF